MFTGRKRIDLYGWHLKIFCQNSKNEKSYFSFGCKISLRCRLQRAPCKESLLWWYYWWVSALHQLQAGAQANFPGLEWPNHGPNFRPTRLGTRGVSSSEFYKIFSQEQLETAQKSLLGVTLGPLTVSEIWKADDSALVSNNIHHLYFLLHLTKIFCQKYQKLSKPQLNHNATQP